MDDQALLDEISAAIQRYRECILRDENYFATREIFDESLDEKIERAEKFVEESGIFEDCIEIFDNISIYSSVLIEQSGELCVNGKNLKIGDVSSERYSDDFNRSDLRIFFIDEVKWVVGISDRDFFETGGSGGEIFVEVDDSRVFAYSYSKKYEVDSIMRSPVCLEALNLNKGGWLETLVRIASHIRRRRKRLVSDFYDEDRRERASRIVF